MRRCFGAVLEASKHWPFNEGREKRRSDDAADRRRTAEEKGMLFDRVRRR